MLFTNSSHYITFIQIYVMVHKSVETSTKRVREHFDNNFNKLNVTNNRLITKSKKQTFNSTITV